MFLLSSFPPQKIMRKHIHTHFNDPIPVLQEVNIETVRKYRLLSRAWATLFVEALHYKPDGRVFDSR